MADPTARMRSAQRGPRRDACCASEPLTSDTLHRHIGRQLTALCAETRLASTAVGAVQLVRDMLGAEGTRPLTEPTRWPSFVADDHTPAEFSLAFSPDKPPTLRVLVERQAPEATASANLRAAVRLTHWLADRYQLPLARFEAVADLFLPVAPQGRYSLWHAVALQPNGRHQFKIYFDPAARGPTRAPALVSRALEQLGFDTAYRTVLTHAVRPGQQADQFAFFGLDLHRRPDARVKVYVAHHDAQLADLERAAQMHDTHHQIRDFCHLAVGEHETFTRRPPLSCYAFVDDSGDTPPSGYTLYLPIRDYVADDEAARARVTTLLERYGADPTVLDRALRAVARRPLNAGVGLISYVSLRMGQWPGLTVYLCSEAYGVTPSGWADRHDGAVPDQSGGANPVHHSG